MAHLSEAPAQRIAIGAEASIEASTFLGRPAVAKRRVSKGYRHPALDARLRSERTREEAHLLLAARRAGVRVPLLFDADLVGCTLVLEHVPGPSLRQQLALDSDAAATSRLEALGRICGRLHEGGVTHGDLTTGNVIVAAAGTSADATLPSGPEGREELVLIDFGLGAMAIDLEERGVDLHLVEEALRATDARAEGLMASFIAGYRETAAQPEATLARLNAIRQRGRYR